MLCIQGGPPHTSNHLIFFLVDKKNIFKMLLHIINCVDSKYLQCFVFAHAQNCAIGTNFIILNKNTYFLLQIRILCQKLCKFCPKLFFRFLIDGAVIAKTRIANFWNFRVILETYEKTCFCDYIMTHICGNTLYSVDLRKCYQINVVLGFNTFRVV